MRMVAVLFILGLPRSSSARPPKSRLALEFRELQQCVELIYAEIDLPQDRAQRTPIELLVVGDHELSERIVTPHHDMGAVLALRIETGFGESFDAVSAREPRQLAQTATSSVPKCSSGTGSLSSWRAAM